MNVKQTMAVLLVLLCALFCQDAHAFYNPQQAAGEVGGLVVVNAQLSTQSTAYDGNGNVAALVNANDGTISANYEYGPFGEVIRMTGLMAFANPFRFSTKYQDNETDLLYYGYRFYNPNSGRWLSRDPIEQQGGINLYEFAANDGLNMFDALGLKATFTPKPLPEHIHPIFIRPGVIQTGNTKNSGDVNWKATACCDGKFKYEITGGIKSEYWWVKGNAAAKAHEETHVGNAKAAVDEINEREDSNCHNRCWGRCFEQSHTACLCSNRV